MKIKIKSGAMIGQDHKFFTAKGKICELVFDVEETIRIPADNARRFKAVANGYGDLKRNYGGGAVYVRVEDVIEIKGGKEEDGIVKRDTVGIDEPEVIVKKESKKIDYIRIVGKQAPWDVKVLAGDKELEVVSATITINPGEPITATLTFNSVNVDIEVLKEEVTALLKNGTVLYSKPVKIGDKK